MVTPAEQLGRAEQPGSEGALRLTEPQQTEPKIPPEEPDVKIAEPPPEAPPSVPRGFINLSGLGAGVRRFAQRYLTSHGDLPPAVFERKIRRDGWINSQQRQLAYTECDFRRAVQRAYGRSYSNLTEAERATIDDALKGMPPGEADADIADVPERRAPASWPGLT